MAFNFGASAFTNTVPLGFAPGWSDADSVTGGSVQPRVLILA